MPADIAALNKSVQLSGAAQDFFEVARLRAYEKSHGIGSGLRLAQSRGTATPRLREMVTGKAAASAASLDGWAGELALIEPASQAFLSLLPGFSAFDRLVTGDHATTSVPMHSRLAAATSAAIASTVGEGVSKPITRMSFNAEVNAAQKVVASIVFSKELLITNESRVNALFDSLLRNAVAQQTDTQFLATISTGTGVPTHASTGKTAAALLHDLDLALQSINNIGAGSRLYFIVPTKEFLTMRMLRDAGGNIVSADGKIGDIQLIPTSAQSSPGVGISYSVLLDASAIGADAGVAIPDASSEANIIMDDTGSGGQVFSLWQQGMLTSRIERWFACVTLRSDGLCVISGEDVTA